MILFTFSIFIQTQIPSIKVRYKRRALLNNLHITQNSSENIIYKNVNFVNSLKSINYTNTNLFKFKNFHLYKYLTTNIQYKFNLTLNNKSLKKLKQINRTSYYSSINKNFFKKNPVTFTKLF